MQVVVWSLPRPPDVRLARCCTIKMISSDILGRERPKDKDVTEHMVGMSGEPEQIFINSCGIRVSACLSN